jgi:hypothetical protein
MGEEGSCGQCQGALLDPNPAQKYGWQVPLSRPGVRNPLGRWHLSPPTEGPQGRPPSQAEASRLRSDAGEAGVSRTGGRTAAEGAGYGVLTEEASGRTLPVGPTRHPDSPQLLFQTCGEPTDTPPGAAAQTHPVGGGSGSVSARRPEARGSATPPPRAASLRTLRSRSGGAAESQWRERGAQRARCPLVR